MGLGRASSRLDHAALHCRPRPSIRVPSSGANAGFGLGVLSKFIEPSMGAVISKILILVLVIAFIQRRPQGLFALRERSMEN